MSELIDNMDREFEFWMANRTKEVTLSGRSYKVAVYNVEVDGPRPGSCYAGKIFGDIFSRKSSVSSSFLPSLQSLTERITGMRKSFPRARDSSST